LRCRRPIWSLRQSVLANCKRTAARLPRFRSRLSPPTLKPSRVQPPHPWSSRVFASLKSYIGEQRLAARARRWPTPAGEHAGSTYIADCSRSVHGQMGYSAVGCVMRTWQSGPGITRVATEIVEFAVSGHGWLQQRAASRSGADGGERWWESWSATDSVRNWRVQDGRWR
jgi:hypothetical protein